MMNGIMPHSIRREFYHEMISVAMLKIEITASADHSGDGDILV